MLASLNPLFWMTLLSCSVLLGCTVTEDTAFRARLERARAALTAKHYYAVLTLLGTIDTDVAPAPAKEYYLMLGLASFKLGDYRHTLEAFQKAQPHSLPLQAYMAYVALLLGDAQRARAIATALELQHGQHPEIAILKGNISLKEHAYRDAEEYFRSASLLDESSLKAYIGLANAYLLQRFFIKAEENYLKAVILSKNDTSAYIALINYYLVTRQYSDAEYTAHIASSRHPHDINFLMITSNLYMTIGKIPEALHILEKALEVFPDFADLKIRLIKSYLTLGKLEEVYPLIQTFVTGENENYHGSIILGEYHLLTGELEISYFHFRNAYMINKNSYILNYYLGLIHLIQHKMRSAAQFLEKSILHFPGFRNSHILLSIVYIYQGKYDLASKHANLVLQLDPENRNAHLINGIALYLQNYLNESKYEIDIINHLNIDDQTVRILQILIHLETTHLDWPDDRLSGIHDSNVEKLFLQLEIAKKKTKNPEDFEKILDLYVKNNPNYLTFLTAGNFYKASNDLDKAKDYFLKAKTANEAMVITYYNLAMLEALQGNRAAAIAYLQQAIERQPGFVKSYRALGSLYEQLKDYQNAKMIYEQGLRYAPEDSVLLNNLAWVNLTYLGDKSAAYLGVRKALSLAPEDPDSQDTLAWWYYLNDNHEHALALLKKIVEAYPANPVYHYHLGMAYFKAQEKPLARLHLQRAMHLGIDDEYKAAILELIQ